MKKFTLTLVSTLFSLVVFAQDFEVPVDVKLDKAEDYAQYEQDVIKCVDWLIETPLNVQKNKRENANAFLLQWLTGSPTVHIGIKPEIVTFMENADLLMIFMGGWAKYSLESNDANNKVACNMAGLEMVIKFYQKNKDIMKKDKNVEKYIKMKEKGALEDHVKKFA